MVDKKLTTTNQEFRDSIENMEKRFQSSPDVKHVDLEPDHYFAHGVYCRKLVIPQGCTLTGKIHRHSCLNVIPVGDITVTTEEGSKRIKGPTIFVSPPGTKRAGRAHAETTWLTFHHTEQTDPDLVEQEVVVDNYFYYENEPDPVFPPAGLNKIEEATLQHLLAKKRRGIK